MYKTFVYGGERLETAQPAPSASGCVLSRAITQIGGGEPAYTHCLEQWFSDLGTALDDLAQRNADDVWLASGLARTVMRMPTHRFGAGVKGMFPFQRRGDLSVDAFQSYWWYSHGPIAAATELALAYVQTHPQPICYESGSTAVDGVTEIYWPDFAAAEAAMASDQMTVDQSTDARKFVDTDSVQFVMMAEEVLVAP